MNFKKFLKLFFAVLILFNFSCTTYKNVPYYQDLKLDSVLKEKIVNRSPLTIQPGDLLAIHVTSLNHEADAAINYHLERPNGNVAVNPDRVDENAVVGYRVDQDGNIHLPMVGVLKLSGNTFSEATGILESKLSEFLTKPNIEIRIQNFRITVLGDVKSPGSFSVVNEQITINEALGLAGDLNSTGLRKNVLLIREINGTREYLNFDLTSKNIFSSPYYYLKNNDVIYVQPNKDKVLSSDSTFQKISLLLSALSLVAIFITSFKK